MWGRVSRVMLRPARLRRVKHALGYRWKPSVLAQLPPAAETLRTAGIALPESERERLAGVATNLAARRFTFLNETRVFGERIVWEQPGRNQLWTYNLHYFDYLVDLGLYFRATGDEHAARIGEELVRDWIAANPPSSLGWQPYPSARRIANWVYAVRLFAPVWAAADELMDTVALSVSRQAALLASDLEYHLLGNHLIADARALVVAGATLSGNGPAGWLAKGLALLWEELDEQTLSDGFHFERSPMYHAIVLQDVLECVLVARAVGADVPAASLQTLARMADALEAVLHPDGDIPLFHDSALGIAPCPAHVLSVAAQVLSRQHGVTAPPSARLLAWIGASGSAMEPAAVARKSAIATAGGFVIVDGDRPGDRLIADCGEIGPRYLPGHGHCSALSYELSCGGERLVVDSGVDAYYADDRWRAFFRGTRAHNTVALADTEQSEIWGQFRVAGSARVALHGSGATDGLAWLEASHNGFGRRHRGLVHKRAIFCLPCGWVVFDRLEGHCAEPAVTLVHLHPDWRPSEATPGVASTAAIGARERIVTFAFTGFTGARWITGDDGAEIQGFYADAFGRRRPNAVLALALPAGADARGAYLVVPGTGPASINQPAEDGIDVGIGAGRWQIARSAGTGWRCTACA